MSRESRAGVGANALGCIYMVLGSLGYVVNDSFTRRAVDDGIGVYQALFVRGIAVLVVFGMVAAVRGDRIRRASLTPPLLLRAGAEMLSATLFFAALIHLEFANAQTILMLVPFAVTLAAALVLREDVGVRRYASVLVGFAGVLLVVRPASNGFSGWSVVVLASAALLVVREFATRRVDPSIPAMHIAMVTAAGLTVVTGALTLRAGWDPMTSEHAVSVGVACCCVIVGYVFGIQTARVGDLSVSAPFRYASLVGAVVVGWVMFDERLDGVALVGCALIVVAGVAGSVSARTSPSTRTPAAAADIAA